MSNKKVTLTSFDGQTFVINDAVALQSQTIKMMVVNGGTDVTIPVARVTGVTLAKVIEYLEKHVEEDNEGVKKFDKDFVNVDQCMLFDLISAAYSLKIKGLLDLTCEAVAAIISRKTPNQIRNIFNILDSRGS